MTRESLPISLYYEFLKQENNDPITILNYITRNLARRYCFPLSYMNNGGFEYEAQKNPNVPIALVASWSTKSRKDKRKLVTLTEEESSVIRQIIENVHHNPNN